MIERNEFIEAVESWSKEPTATTNDSLLAAFVTLRLLTSEVFKLVGSCRYESSFQNVKSFLAILNNRVDQWEDKWLRACRDGEEIRSLSPGTPANQLCYLIRIRKLPSVSHPFLRNSSSPPVVFSTPARNTGITRSQPRLRHTNTLAKLFERSRDVKSCLTLFE
jgi:hypothetical protein